MPTELLIAFIAFGVFPVALMGGAWLMHYFIGPLDDQYTNPAHWGSQDTDRRNTHDREV